MLKMVVDDNKINKTKSALRIHSNNMYINTYNTCTYIY